jgi:enoyl-CoA hydratase/carnithine racemase
MRWQVDATNRTIITVDYDNLTVGVTDGVARILLNRPDRRNALSIALLEELAAAMRTIGGTPDVSAVIIEGAGPVFSAGHDLSEMLDREPLFYNRLFTECSEVMLAFQRLPQPVIAKVHGVATAAGCQLVAACDLAVAAEGTRFATPGVRIGLFCSTPMVPITRAIGRKRALEMLLTGEPISAATALEWGLVNRVVPAAHLESEVVRLVAQIRRFSPDIIAIGKDAFYRQIDETQVDAYEITGPIMSGNATHPDAQEGMAAFLEKRPPEWGG